MSGAWGDDMLDWDRDDDPRPVHSTPAQCAATPPGGDPVAWLVDGLPDVKCLYFEKSVAEWKAGEFEDKHREPMRVTPLYATPQAQEPAWREALEQALDAIQGQCDAMRSLKGWRLNLIRENLAKAGAALAASSQHSGQKGADESDVRWAVNVLLETIASKFEAWDTMDLWRSDAASTVRSFKHDLSSAPSPGGSASIGRVDREGGFNAARMYAPDDFAQHNAEIVRLRALVEQQRIALTAYRMAQKWATGTASHAMALQEADNLNPLPAWYDIPALPSTEGNHG